MKLFLYKTVLCVGVLLAGATSCLRENYDMGQGEGYVQIRLTNNLQPIEVTTKSDDPIIYALQIVDKKGAVVKRFEDHTQMPDQIEIRAGVYRVKAFNDCGDTDAGFDKPYYSGESELTVKAGTVNPVSVECCLANVKVSVQFSDAIKSNFSEYSATVTNGSGGTLLFNAAENRAGYLKNTGTLHWTLDLKNTNGSVFQLSETIEQVQVREHYRLSFNVNESGDPTEGGINSDITVDDATNEHNHNIDIVLNPKAKPQFTGSGFNLDTPFQANEGVVLSCDVNVTAEAGLKELQLTHASDYLTSRGIPTSFSLVHVDQATAAVIHEQGITWTTPVLQATTSKISFGTLLSTLPLGDYTFGFIAYDAQNQRVEKSLRVTVLPNVEVTTLQVEEIWAKFATIQGQWNTLEQPDGVGLLYKKESDAGWITVPSERLVISGTRFSAEVLNLDPETSYQVKAVTKNETGANVVVFTTQTMSQFGNMNFDQWKNNKTLQGGWCSGNNTFATMTTQETSRVVAGSAVKMIAKEAVGIFAAGNLFAGGNFKIVGMSGGEMDFGISYGDRPTTFSGYYDYTPGVISKFAKSPYTVDGQNDICQIYVLLTDWDKPFHVNTTTSTLINMEDPAIIASAIVSSDQPTSGYKQFTVPLEYRSTRMPKYVVIVASTSKYGDYFSGSTSSVLYVDEFSFGFDGPVVWRVK